MKTFFIKPSSIFKQWWILDAKDLILGRLASLISKLLRGKHKSSYTPHLDCGDYVVVINARFIALTGRKLHVTNGKKYYKHTGFPGGIKEITAASILSSRYPERVLIFAIKRMLPSSTLGQKQLKHLYIYPNSEHPHSAQKPNFYDFTSKNIKNKIQC